MRDFAFSHRLLRWPRNLNQREASMKRDIKCITSSAAFISIFVATPAAAQDAGFYLGASVGQSKAADTCSDMPAGVSCDDKTTTWKLLGGYQFNPYIGAELGHSPSLPKESAT